MPEKKNKYEEAAKKFKPDKIKILFIAESPPHYEKGEEARYFYFKELTGKDYLFREIMKVLYLNGDHQFRKNEDKTPSLKKFQEDGFFLIDACEHPTKKDKDACIKENFPKLSEKIRKIIDKDTKIILIKKNVFELREKLESEKFNVINTEQLDFPSHGNQIKFREKLMRLLAEYGFYDGTWH